MKEIRLLKAQNLNISKEYGAYTVWDFEEGNEGFSAVGNSELKQGKGSVIFSAEDKDAYMQSAGGLSIPAETVTTIEIRLKTSDASSLFLRWRQENGGYFGDNSVQISLKKDSEFHDYQIHLAGNSYWQQTVNQICFAVSEKSTVEISHIRLTGLYLMTFPWVNFSFDHDVALINSIKNSFVSDDNSTAVGFTFNIDYGHLYDENGNYDFSEKIEYALKLSETIDMPVVFWLRADPWGDINPELYNVDSNLMWTEELISSPVYRNNRTGYRNMCLAQTDVNGNKTPYWEFTEVVLDKLSKQVAEAAAAHPGQIMGITTTSEYRYCTEEFKHYLDYNPNTIAEFRTYCQNLYERTQDINDAVGTSFETWEFRSTDGDPSTVENKNGFDAPRDDTSSAEFWALWKNFRAHQIHTAVSKLVEIIGKNLDPKYIYTHQISYNDDLTASPITCGNVEGSNVGIDFFNYEANDENLTAIQKFIGTDVNRTWGCPEWMITTSQDYARSYKALDNMVKAGAKYIAPFNYGSNDDYDVQNSESEKAISDYVKLLESKGNPLINAEVKASASIKSAENLTDVSRKNGCTADGIKSGDSISFKLKEKTNISSLTFVAPSNKNLLVGKIAVYANGDKMGEYEFEQNDSEELTVIFDSVKTNEIKIEIVEPAKDSKGENALELSIVKAGRHENHEAAPQRTAELLGANVNDKDIDISWTTVDGDGITYALEISTSEKFRSSDTLYTDSTSVKINRSGKNKKYYYRVWAVTAGGCTVSETGVFEG